MNNDTSFSRSNAASQSARAAARAEKWRNAEHTWPRIKNQLTNVFCTCAAGGASHLGCMVNIFGTGLLSAAGGGATWIPALQAASYAVPIGLSMVAWWGTEKLRPSTSLNERRNRKWAAGVGCAAVMGGTALFNHHNYVDEYRYFAELSPAQQDMIRTLAKDSPAGKNLTPVEYIREIDCLPETFLSQKISKFKRLASNKVNEIKESLVP
jgi:hypothetical protein